ncbi:MAG: hypothetical protein QOJ84_2619 [Bradyrhizobium sp.]|jgi:hypothetical protein|nr:hypothetical protein [Bradyrhizobium sp.]
MNEKRRPELGGVLDGSAEVVWTSVYTKSQFL